ncbi:hypothetical protein J7T55_004939 [Diaporthe amygdali]|uniref:uncharacterized protein n=1 Tax=Phomopsis amygdali TaxID=1214568 RepID=UPI0022FE9947|nr:uncharacterized protein J7T55_004939 [Diaporthe amygdali]KAJ0114695.1 hypothetical protein J7T55_004939 [Diaporthe amygdali]
MEVAMVLERPVSSQEEIPSVVSPGAQSVSLPYLEQQRHQQASAATQSPQASLGSAQVAGIAIGSSIGGILFILFIISTLMWYHRRKLPKPDGDERFNPATDSVREMFDGPGNQGSQSQTVSMYDPAAWRENYSASSPRELEGRPSLQSPRRVASEAWLRGSVVSVSSPVSTNFSQGTVSHKSSASWQDGMVMRGDLAPAPAPPYARRVSARASPIAELPA